MNSYKKLRKFFTKQSNDEFYVYMPLSDNKNGYIMEYYYQKYYQLFYYKYKESESGTLTKYGYLVVDAHDNRLYASNDNSKNIIHSSNSSKNQRKNSKNNSSASVNKSLWSNKDKECIFYQAVADKIQIDLENRWMELLRKKGRVDIKAVNGNDSGFNGEYQEWNQLMQHNNDFLISDYIQRRRLDEVIGNPVFDSGNDNNYLKNIGVNLQSERKDEVDNSGSVNFDKIKFTPKLPSLSINYQYFSQSPISSSPTTYSPLISPTSLSALSPLFLSKPSPTISSSISPPISPPISPKPSLSPICLNERTSSLPNLSMPKKPTPSKSRSMENQRSKKKDRKFKFSRKEPDMLIFDPEDNLVFKDCECDHCMLGIS